VAARQPAHRFDRVLLAVDSAADRIAAQAALPRWIANAWTQPENIGVSRHSFLGEAPCVACLYMPQGASKNRDEVFAEALHVEDDEERMGVRKLLYYGTPVGEAFVARMAQRFRVPMGSLRGFVTAPLERFYTEALCGGLLLRLGGVLGPNTAAEVPMAFQSALSGILLAAELVIDAGRLRATPLPSRTELDVLRPLGGRLNSPARKHASGRCICQDPDYQRAYAAKYDMA
jgi:hypothetical protein